MTLPVAPPSFIPPNRTRSLPVIKDETLFSPPLDRDIEAAAEIGSTGDQEDVIIVGPGSDGGLTTMTLAQLKNVCTERGVPSHGRKRDIIARLSVNNGEFKDES